MRVQAYLFFDGRCEEAIEFYRTVFPIDEVMMMRFKDSPEPPPPGQMPPGSENKIMHAYFRIGETEIMASDGFCAGKTAFEGFALSFIGKDSTEAETVFNRLAEGGEIRMPMAKTFFSDSFGMVVDRFGLLWNVLAEPAQQAEQGKTQ